MGGSLARPPITFRVFTLLIFSLSQISQPGQSQLRPSNEHLLSVRGLRAKKLAARLTPLHHTTFLSAFPLSPFQADNEEQPSTARVERGPSEAARSASKEGSPHCQPLTSYPFSIKHRTTASENRKRGHAEFPLVTARSS